MHEEIKKKSLNQYQRIGIENLRKNQNTRRLLKKYSHDLISFIYVIMTEYLNYCKLCLDMDINFMIDVHNTKY